MTQLGFVYSCSMQRSLFAAVLLETFVELVKQDWLFAASQRRRGASHLTVSVVAVARVAWSSVLQDEGPITTILDFSNTEERLEKIKDQLWLAFVARLFQKCYSHPLLSRIWLGRSPNASDSSQWLFGIRWGSWFRCKSLQPVAWLWASFPGKTSLLKNILENQEGVRAKPKWSTSVSCLLQSWMGLLLANLSSGFREACRSKDLVWLWTTWPLSILTHN